jgi:hypothetical protein
MKGREGGMKTPGWAAVVVWVLILMVPSGSFAARPLITEDAGTVEKGAVEVELAFDHSRDDNRDKYSVPSLQFAYGLTERLEIAAGVPYVFLDPQEGEKEEGIGDVYAYLKYRVWGEKEIAPALTVKPFLKLPTASESKGLGSGEADLGLTAAFSKAFVGFNLHADATYTILGEKDVTDQFSLGLAGEFEISKGLNFVSEIRYGNNFNTSHKDDPATLMAGFQADIAGAIFDAGFKLGLNSAAADYLISVGVTLKFK